MGQRRRARELALQALFYMDMSRDPPEESLGLFCRHFGPSEKTRSFFMRLVQGVQEKRGQIDALIERFSENWKMYRMSTVDRNVMRIAVFEILFCDDIPPKVSINEAIEIGKKFGSEDSGSFINGILDTVRLEMIDRADAPPLAG